MPSNPVMERNPYFQPGATTPNAYLAAGTGVPEAAVRTAEYTYEAPQAAEAALGQGAFGQQLTGRMRYNDALEKTAILLGITVISAVAAWMLLPLQVLMPLAIGGSIAALVIGMIAGSQRMVNPALAVAYAVLEGATLGAITGALNMSYPGIAFQAILGTMVVVAVAVGLHVSGKVRTSAKGRRLMLTLMIAAIGYALIDLVLVLTGVLDRSMDFFMVGGVPIGIIFGLVLIVAAGYMMIGDLELIRYAEENGAPAEFAWTCAFGLVLSIIWIYIEVLRVLAILASDR